MSLISSYELPVRPRVDCIGLSEWCGGFPEDSIELREHQQSMQVVYDLCNDYIGWYGVSHMQSDCEPSLVICKYSIDSLIIRI